MPLSCGDREGSGRDTRHEYADAVVDAIGDQRDLVVVGHRKLGVDSRAALTGLLLGRRESDRNL